MKLEYKRSKRSKPTNSTREICGTDAKNYQNSQFLLFQKCLKQTKALVRHCDGNCPCETEILDLQLCDKSSECYGDEICDGGSCSCNHFSDYDESEYLPVCAAISLKNSGKVQISEYSNYKHAKYEACTQKSEVSITCSSSCDDCDEYNNKIKKRTNNIRKNGESLKINAPRVGVFVEGDTAKFECMFRYSGENKSKNIKIKWYKLGVDGDSGSEWIDFLSYEKSRIALDNLALEGGSDLTLRVKQSQISGFDDGEVSFDLYGVEQRHNGTYVCEIIYGLEDSKFTMFSVIVGRQEETTFLPDYEVFSDVQNFEEKSVDDETTGEALVSVDRTDTTDSSYSGNLSCEVGFIPKNGKCIDIDECAELTEWNVTKMTHNYFKRTYKSNFLHSNITLTSTIF